MEESIRKPIITTPSISGAVCNFKSAFAGLPLKSHVIDIDYTGSAISNCFVVNMADITNISYFKGLLNGTYGFVDLGSIAWSLLGSGRHRTSYIPNMYEYSGDDTGFICSTYRSVILNDIADIDKSITLYTSGGYLYGQVNDTDLNGISGADFKTAMNGVYLIYKLATTTTPTITVDQFNTLLSAFNISGEAFKIPFDTPIYGGTYDAITGILTSTKASDGSDISPVEYQLQNCRLESLLGENNIWADTGNSVIQPFKVS